MKKALKYTLIIIAAFLAIPLLMLILLLLCFPIRYKFSAKIDEKKDVRLKISYLFGFVRYIYLLDDQQNEGSLRILWFKFGNKNKTGKKPSKKNFFEPKEIYSFVRKNLKKGAKNDAQDSKDSNLNLKDGLTLSEIKTIIKESVNTLKKLLLALRPGYFRFSGEVGLMCPADTAYLYGVFMAVSHFLGISKNISLHPVFQNDSFVWRIDTDARGSVNIYRLLFPLAALALSTPIKNMILKGETYE